jgi:2-dehydro-3-deoxyglucarate aldolase
MEKSNLKQKLKDKEITIGSWITIGHTTVAEIMVNAGFDWLAIDMEHSSITMAEAQNLIQVIDLAGGVPLVRVGANDPYLIKRAMDAGAHGVIIPMVNTKINAQDAVNAVKYPPIGTRGVGLSRAQGYGGGFNEYVQWLQDFSVVIVQIEHIDGVNNLEEILSVDHVDGFIVGPYDLSGSLGVPGDFDHPDVLRALRKINQISKRFDANSGYHVIPPNLETLQEKIEEGYRFLAFSLDILFLGNSIKELMKNPRKLIESGNDF